RFHALYKRIFNREKILSLIRVNADIMIRTLALLSGFAWFANQGAEFGDTILAANHVLLQFVSLSAFFLDGYAHVAEMLTGKAYGAKDRLSFSREVKDSSILAGATALVLAIGIFGFGDLLISLLSQDVGVQQVASEHLLYAAIYIGLSFAAFQLDGVFIGITKSTEMRNATILALLVFITAAYILTPHYGNVGLWISFIIYVVARAIMLGAYYPGILRKML
ncbi:MAG: MATE family efflux transporter, partial [Sphingobacterium sp.]